ncbi:menaquinone-dependent protoporphyrinogen oxidase [Halobiforma haloterrestris]|uniref:Menaquinone-dependent protoporphyrinogen oxidase n=2 Tax=Natronobacterium haloterrestre TaxID=148448 RepID=A0A1I1JTB1_NATHA|nr:menaquinone-dependent protoporphyrinogen oxidase [Halobiforma haloterrestris]
MFLEDTDWYPDRIGLFGGALRYSKYGFLKRLMMKQIARRTISEMSEADASGDVEFTDWVEVEAFAADVAAFVEGRLGVTSPAVSESELSE